MGSWRRHSREFKKQAVEKMKTSDNIHELARELGVERNCSTAGDISLREGRRKTTPTIVETWLRTRWRRGCAERTKS
jgi:transposase-like protein